MLIRPALREDRSWVYDSRRWHGFDARPGDVLVATPPKCGTTWTQYIVGMLLRQSAEPFAVTMEQPWVDGRFLPDEVLAMLLARPGRRSLKTHLAFDAIPMFDDMRYIHVARDPRDACMSWYNHETNYSADALARLDQWGLADPTIARPYPRPPRALATYFRWFMGDDSIAGRCEGFSLREYRRTVESYWAERQQPNVLLIHYNDLKADLAGETQRIADFLGVATPPPLQAEIVAAADFAAMKRLGAALLPTAAMAWEGGAETFLHRGTNARWRDIVTPADEDRYAAAMADVAPPLRAWMERGRQGADPRALTD